MSKRGSSEGSDRFEYLQSLVTEFQDTDSEGGWNCSYRNIPDDLVADRC